MRQIVLALLLIAAMLPVPAQGQASVEMAWTANGAASPLTVDLVADAGTVILFKVHEDVIGTASTASVELTCEERAAGATKGCIRKEEFSLTMQKSGESWTAGINVDDKRLVADGWRVAIKAGSNEVAAGTLTVNAPTMGNIVLRVLNTDPDTGVVWIGAGQNVQVTARHAQTVTAPMFKSVEYAIDGGQHLAWNSPYTLSSAAFTPGQHTMTVYAEDRVGQEAHLSFHVHADTVRPEVTATLPEVMYRDIPNPVRLIVDEHTDFQATATFGAATATANGTAGTGREVILMLTPREVASGALQVVVRDRVGNELSLSQASRVEPLRTDMVLGAVEQIDRGAIPGEQLKLRVTASQLDGLADVPVTVIFGGSPIGEFTVNRTIQTTHELSFDLPPGQHTDVLALLVPEGVNEVNMTNQEREVSIDKFLARVFHGNDRYHIRADATGLPLEAVDEDGNTYPLRTADRGLGTIYMFTVDGTDLWWDPSSTTTTVPLEEPDGDKGIPAVPVAVLLVAIALIARRR